MMALRWSASQGMTLMELLIALGLGTSLSAALLQLFTAGMHLQARQSAVQDLQQRSAYVQFLLRAAILGSASPCVADNSGSVTGERPALAILQPHAAAVQALPGSQVLRVPGGDCEVPAHFYYIGRGGGDADSPPGLFRRRQRSDGSYRPSEELVEGVTGMTATAGIRVSPPSSAQAHVAYVDAELVDDWSRAFSINLTLSVRQVSVAGEMSGDSLTIVFSTALRQADLPGSGLVTE